MLGTLPLMQSFDTWPFKRGDVVLFYPLPREPAGCRPFASHLAVAAHPSLWCCPCRRKGGLGSELWTKGGPLGTLPLGKPTAIFPHPQENGQVAVSAGSVQGLLGVVRSWGRDPAQVPLALKALVGAVHVLHASRAPPRGPELRALLEGYFHILNADWPASPSSGPEEAHVTLRVSMLGRYGLPGPSCWWKGQTGERWDV